MKVSELIEKLQQLMNSEGDLEVVASFAPEMLYQVDKSVNSILSNGITIKII